MFNKIDNKDYELKYLLFNKNIYLFDKILQFKILDYINLIKIFDFFYWILYYCKLENNCLI